MCHSIVRAISSESGMCSLIASRGDKLSCVRRLRWRTFNIEGTTRLLYLSSICILTVIPERLEQLLQLFSVLLRRSQDAFADNPDMLKTQPRACGPGHVLGARCYEIARGARTVNTPGNPDCVCVWPFGAFPGLTTGRAPCALTCSCDSFAWSCEQGRELL